MSGWSGPLDEACRAMWPDFGQDAAEDALARAGMLKAIMAFRGSAGPLGAACEVAAASLSTALRGLSIRALPGGGHALVGYDGHALSEHPDHAEAEVALAFAALLSARP